MRYTNGNTPQQQKEQDRRYRQKQRNIREWVDGLARSLDITRDELTTPRWSQRIREALNND